MSQKNATQDKLAYVNDNGAAIIKVDNTTFVPWNEKRNSVSTSPAKRVRGRVIIEASSDPQLLFSPPLTLPPLRPGPYHHVRLLRAGHRPHHGREPHSVRLRRKSPCPPRTSVPRLLPARCVTVRRPLTPDDGLPPRGCWPRSRQLPKSPARRVGSDPTHGRGALRRRPLSLSSASQSHSARVVSVREVPASVTGSLVAEAMKRAPTCRRKYIIESLLDMLTHAVDRFGPVTGRRARHGPQAARLISSRLSTR